MAIRTAILGYGLAGRHFHAPLICATTGLELVALGTSRAGQVPDGVRVGSPAELIADPEIDLIVIASPNQSHFELAHGALEAGKHVVVDKPMCVTSGEAERLIDMAGRLSRLLVPFHNRRWDSDYLTVRKLMASGMLGQVMLFEAHWDRFRPEVAERWREMPESGSGLMFDLGPHLIDQALLLFGQPQAVSADLAMQREGSQVDDYFSLTMHYGPCRVILSAASVVADPRPRFAIHGTRGSFVKYGLDPQEDQLRAGIDPFAADFGVEDPSTYGILTREGESRTAIASERGDWLSFYRGVVASIADGSPSPVAPADALAGLKIIEAAANAAPGRTEQLC
ncbi:MAG TPA: oxidoreductase [Sphingomicrobium sp.]|nr:oxidoreductase [Sphingomicrobium sp.]